MQTVPWAVPPVQTLHILAISAVLVSTLVLSIRAIGLAGVYLAPARWLSRLSGRIAQLGPRTAMLNIVDFARQNGQLASMGGKLVGR